MKQIKDIPYGNSHKNAQVLDLYIPDSHEFPVFVYFHGGGLESGSKEAFRFKEELVRKGICVAAANYRLYPHAKFPEFVEDAAAAVAWVKNNISQHGKCTHLFVGGSSAGGYLTQMLCFDKSYFMRYDMDADSISGYFMDAGQPTAHFNVLRERGIDPRRVIVDETAPLFFVEGNRQYPPMKIVISDRDIPGRLEQTQLLLAALKHFGNDMRKIDFEQVANSTHCSYVDQKVFAEMIYHFISQVTNSK